MRIANVELGNERIQVHLSMHLHVSSSVRIIWYEPFKAWLRVVTFLLEEGRIAFLDIYHFDYWLSPGRGAFRQISNVGDIEENMSLFGANDVRWDIAGFAENVVFTEHALPLSNFFVALNADSLLMVVVFTDCFRLFRIFRLVFTFVFVGNGLEYVKNTFTKTCYLGCTLVLLSLVSSFDVCSPVFL